MGKSGRKRTEVGESSPGAFFCAKLLGVASASEEYRREVRGPSGWRQVAEDESESPLQGSLARAVVAGWVAASACCRVVSAKVLGGVVVSTRGMMGVKTTVSICCGVVSAGVVGGGGVVSEKVAVRVPAVVSTRGGADSVTIGLSGGWVWRRLLRRRRWCRAFG
jgi:hypothetical protein